MRFRFEFVDKSVLVLEDKTIDSVEKAALEMVQFEHTGCWAFRLSTGMPFFVYKHQVKHVQVANDGEGFVVNVEHPW